MDYKTLTALDEWANLLKHRMFGRKITCSLNPCVEDNLSRSKYQFIQMGVIKCLMTYAAALLFSEVVIMISNFLWHETKNSANN